ncbi:glycosyltransferase [Shewanella eurypsychrophilus]|uniref:Glycosyltransferase n=1 Tax=Shewanella eurypsychrophilus TaxID=2593656 RepID=A0ABX6V7L7_9GAMM|nr:MULTISPECIES: glycosyltransferase family 2 protein [Shewanella]QFU23415.1 glycosyltransferase [Shewanella sp. YLB-09]QPG58643.1 glycosyltransferase [Shewanella eurypsychrophilus]
MTPKVSVIMPVYNVQHFVKSAIHSVLMQTFTDFELIIVNDCATDKSLEVCHSVLDHRIRIVNHQQNKGLAAARNTGIRHAIGKFIAFIDSDDMWHPDKLRLHVAHLAQSPKVGISFSRSSFMDHKGKLIHFYQMPQLKGITAAHLLCRNPVGNGSAPVIRRETLNDIRFQALNHNEDYSCYFDERFRQSEDIECWLRIVATTDWQMEGIPAPLTFYRLNQEGLSSNTMKQLASWEMMIDKAKLFAPKLLKKHEQDARAYQLRYLARQAIRNGQGKSAIKLINKALKVSPNIMMVETGRTCITLTAAYLLWILPPSVYKVFENVGQYFMGHIQKMRISKDGVKSSLIS